MDRGGREGGQQVRRATPEAAGIRHKTDDPINMSTANLREGGGSQDGMEGGKQGRKEPKYIIREPVGNR